MEPEDYLQDPQATSAEEPDAAPASAEEEPAPAETEPAPVETEPAPAETEPAPAETEPAPVETEPAPVPAEENRSDSEQPEPEQTSQAAPEQLVNVPSVDAIYPPDELNETDDEVRRPLTTGQQNIVKRAEQMLSVRWTPRKKITGWGNTFSYEAGVTYTGLPYGQPVNAAYVPWTASLMEFVNAVNNPNSLMYTSRSEYYKVAPYYSVDCSAFVSWAWDLPHRCTTRSIGSFGKLISSNSYANIQVGDMLNNVTSHVILVTDVTYDSTGALTGIRISQASPQASYYGCCRSTWYRGSTGLATFRSNYFNSGYALYRSLTRENVTYTHDCAVPLEGDECAICGVGMLLKPGVDVSQWQGVIDWQTIAAHISFAILRIGYHGKDGKLYLDKQFEANVTGCVNNGIPYGVYFYSLATDAASAKAEAEFVRTKLNGRALTLPVFMGVENSDTILTDSMTAAKLLTITSAFCSNLGSYEPGIYASESPWNSLMTDPAYNNWARWVAKWKTPDGNATGSVTMPLNVSGGANVWQYGANRLPGVTMTDKNGTPTMIDVDYWFGPVGNTEHRYTANITSPSCTKTGWLTYRCVDCGQKVSKNLAAPGHFFMDGICKRCGKEETTFDHFTDLNENAWYAEAVSFVLDRGYFHGVSETKFAPSEKMTRAMLVTVLYRIAGEPSVPSGSLFDDVSAGAYYANAVTWAANNGITNGTDERHFSPNQPITREETAVFLYRYAALVGGMSTSLRADLSAFPDAGDISVFARDAVSWAVAMDILRGTLTDNGILIQPKRDANRAEIATLLMRFVLRQEQKAP